MIDISIQPVDLWGKTAYLAQNKHLEMTLVPELGSRVISLRCKKTNTELLHMPSSIEQYGKTPLLYGIPVLFPPNRIEDGKFTFGGRSYQFDMNEPLHRNHAHGLVHAAVWDVTAIQTHKDFAVIKTEIDSTNHPGIQRQFPHPFRLVMRLTIIGTSLIQEVEIHNDSNDPFPWGLGYHTSFRFPFYGHSDPGKCTFSAPIGKRWELNDRFLPTGKQVEDAKSVLLLNSMNMGDVCLDDVFAADQGMPNEVVLADPDADLRVIYRADPQFKQWVLHNGDGKSGYLCPEPYTCVTNAFNLPLNQEQTGLQVLGPGQYTKTRCIITVEHLSNH